jgi:hypothetical protein
MCVQKKRVTLVLDLLAKTFTVSVPRSPSLWSKTLEEVTLKFKGEGEVVLKPSVPIHSSIGGLLRYHIPTAGIGVKRRKNGK